MTFTEYVVGKDYLKEVDFIESSLELLKCVENIEKYGSDDDIVGDALGTIATIKENVLYYVFDEFKRNTVLIEHIKSPDLETALEDYYIPYLRENKEELEKKLAELKELPPFRRLSVSNYRNEEGEVLQKVESRTYKLNEIVSYLQECLELQENSEVLFTISSGGKLGILTENGDFSGFITKNDFKEVNE